MDESWYNSLPYLKSNTYVRVIQFCSGITFTIALLTASTQRLTCYSYLYVWIAFPTYSDQDSTAAEHPRGSRLWRESSIVQSIVMIIVIMLIVLIIPITNHRYIFHSPSVAHLPLSWQRTWQEYYATTWEEEGTKQTYLQLHVSNTMLLAV